MTNPPDNPGSRVSQPPIQRFSALLLLLLAFFFSAAPVEAAEAADARGEEPTASLFHADSSWQNVLESFAEATHSTLVARSFPEGRFTRLDRKTFTRTEGVAVLNDLLAEDGFRLVEQGEFLTLLDVQHLRTRYGRPPAPEPSSAPGNTYRKADFTGFKRPKHSAHTIRPASTRTGSAKSNAVSTTLQVTGHEPSQLLRRLVSRFSDRAEVTSNNPLRIGWRSRTRRNAKRSDDRGRPIAGNSGAFTFTATLKDASGDIELQGSPAVLDQASRLIGILGTDRAARTRRGSERMVVVDDPVGRRRKVESIVARLATAPQQNQTSPSQAETGANPTAPAEAAAQPPNGTRQPPVTNLPIDQLQGDVTVEVLEGLGVLVLRGDQQDVATVANLLERLEQLGAQRTADIHLLMLRYVDSVALAELMNLIYERLGAVGGTALGGGPPVAVIPVVKPNAILILATAADLPSVIQLAEQLDQPVDPASEVQVFYLQHAVAAQVLTTLETFYSERGGLGTRVRAVVDARTNAVIVQARPRDLDEVAELIRKVDRDESQAVSQVRVVPLERAAAPELAAVIGAALQSVISAGPDPGGARPAGGTGTPDAAQLQTAKSLVFEFFASADAPSIRSGVIEDVRITPDPRTNSLVVTAPERTLPLVLKLIEVLDQPAAVVSELKVFALSNADAVSMVQLLERMFGDSGMARRQGGGGSAQPSAEEPSLVPLRFSVDPRTNSIVASGPPETLEIVEAVLLRLDQSDVRGRQNVVYRLKNVPAEEVGLAINAFLESQRELTQVDPELVSAVEQLEREVIVVPEAVSNSLLISATPRFFEDIVELISKIDEAPPQVVIQALLVEVELDATDEFGVELGFQDPVLFDRSVIDDVVTISETFTAPNGVQTTTQQIISQTAVPGFPFNNQPLGNNVAVSPETVGSQALSNFSLGRINPELGFGGLVLAASSEAVNVLVRALAASRSVHILSRPQIRTLDNQLAQILVGEQVPVVDGVTLTGLGTANPVIRQDEAGIILSVTPRITPEEQIVMEVIAEKSQFTGQGVPIFVDGATGNTIEAPRKNITTARTVISVPNGQTVVIGGMITKTDEMFERKVPHLADIPLIGFAFRYDSHRVRRRELLMFLTPRIVRTDADSELIKQVEAERIHFLEKEAEAVHGPLFAVPAAAYPPEGMPAETLPPGALPSEACPPVHPPTTPMPGEEMYDRLVPPGETWETLPVPGGREAPAGFPPVHQAPVELEPAGSIESSIQG